MAQLTKLKDEVLTSYLDGLYDESQSHKAKYFAEQAALIPFAKGVQWKDGSRRDKIKLTVNCIEFIKERMVGFLTDVRPSFRVVARKQGLEQIAEMLEKTCLAIWDDAGFSETLDEVLDNEFLMGTSGVAVLPKEGTFGTELEFPVIDARFLQFDVNGRRPSDKLEYVMVETKKSLDYLHWRYKDKAKNVKPDYSQEDDERSLSSMTRFYSAAMTMPRITSFFNRSKKTKVERASLRDWWVIDARVNESDKPYTIDMNGFTRVVEPGGYLYACGRHIIQAGEVILIDEPGIYWDNDFPHVLTNWRRNPDSLWGFSEVQELKSAQETVNKTGSTVLEIGLLMSNPVWIGDKIALLPKEWTALSNKPGLFVPKRPNTELRREPGVPPPRELNDFWQANMSLMEKLSGVDTMTDAGNILSMVAIDSYQMNAQVIVRKRARRMEDFIRRVFQKVIWRIFQFYTDDRVMNMMGQDEKVVDFVYERQRIIELLAAQQIDISQAAKYFPVKVQPISQLSVSKMQRANLAIQLWNAGLLDFDSVHEMIDTPYRDTIRAKVMKDHEDKLMPSKEFEQALKDQKKEIQAAKTAQQKASPVALDTQTAQATQPMKTGG